MLILLCITFLFVRLSFHIGNKLLEGNSCSRFVDDCRVLRQFGGCSVEAFVAVACRVSFLPAVATFHVFEWVGSVTLIGTLAFVFALSTTIASAFLGVGVGTWGRVRGIMSVPCSLSSSFAFVRARGS